MWCVPDLLTDQARLARLILPLAKEQLAQERVQGLLLAAQLLASAGILLLEGAEKPLQHQHASLRWVFLGGGGDEDGGVLGPVRGEFNKRGGGEDEGRRSHGRQVAIEGGDGLQERQCAGFYHATSMVRCGHTLRKLDHEPFCFWGTAAPSWPLLELMVKDKLAGMQAQEEWAQGLVDSGNVEEGGDLASQCLSPGGSHRRRLPA